MRYWLSSDVTWSPLAMCCVELAKLNFKVSCRFLQASWLEQCRHWRDIVLIRRPWSYIVDSARQLSTIAGWSSAGQGTVSCSWDIIKSRQTSCYVQGHDLASDCNSTITQPLERPAFSEEHLTATLHAQCHCLLHFRAWVVLSHVSRCAALYTAGQNHVLFAPSSKRAGAASNAPALAMYQADASLRASGAAHSDEGADTNGSETLLSKQLCDVYDAASLVAAEGGRAAAEATKAAEAAKAAVEGAHAAAQRASDTVESAQRAVGDASAAAHCAEEAAQALLRTAQGRTWKAVLDGGAPLWCAVLGTVFLGVFLWSVRKKFTDMSAKTNQGALHSLAAAHPEAVCVNGRMEWFGSRAERVYLADPQESELCRHLFHGMLCLTLLLLLGRNRLHNY